MSNLFDISSLAMIPTAYKDGRLYSIRPVTEFGSELITNGSFDTDSDWTKAPSGASISGGKAILNSSSDTYIYQDILTAGKTYRVEFDAEVTSGSFYVGENGQATSIYGVGSYTNEVLYFDVTSSARFIFRRTGSGTLNVSIDNVSVKEVSNIGDFDFSRGTTATRVASSGYIEKGRENLLLQSNTFDTTWFLNRTSATSGQSGYDGSNDAWLLEADVAGSLCNVNQSVSISGVMTASIYAKEGTTNWFRFSVNDSGVNTRAWFDLSGSGAVGTTAGNIIDAKIESVDNGYFRCSITFNATATNLLLFVTNADNSVSYSVGDNIYIQDAQLEQGLVATDYIETTTTSASAGILEDMPRLDYSGSCPALLLEPQRTNSLPHSENFNAWAKQSGVSVDVNTTDTLSPEGKYNSCKITSTSGTTGLYAVRSGGFETNAATRSVYLKGENGGEELVLKDGSGFGGTKNITLTTEWVRYELKTTADGNNYQGFFIDDVPTDSAVYAYGAQMETGSYPTSYIPTYGASVTRNGDRCINTSATSIVGQTQGSIFLEYDNTNTDSSGGQVRASIHSSGFTDWIFLGEESGNYRMYFRVNGSVLLNSQAAPANGTNKICIAYNESGDIRMFFNGSKVGTYSTAFTFNGTLNTIEFGNGGWNVSSSNAFKQYDIFPTALTDSECIALTTL